MFDIRTGLFFFACLNDAAGAALKNVARAPTKTAPGGSGSATLTRGVCQSGRVWIRSKNMGIILCSANEG